ncbi:hypothetical protein FB33_2647, partial [Cutibacterium acnes]
MLWVLRFLVTVWLRRIRCLLAGVLGGWGGGVGWRLVRGGGGGGGVGVVGGGVA